MSAPSKASARLSSRPSSRRRRSTNKTSRYQRLPAIAAFLAPVALAALIAVATGSFLASATPVPSVDCYDKTQADCNEAPTCTYQLACSGCVPAPCDWFFDESSCPSWRCSWNSTLQVCADGKPECYQRTTEAQCNDDAPECHWDTGAQFCLASMDYCYWISEETSCNNDPECGYFDGTCYASHRVPECEEIHTVSACYVVDGCAWESYTHTCYNTSKSDFCGLIAQNQIVCEYHAPTCTFDSSYGCLPADMCKDPTKEAISVVFSFDVGLTYWVQDLTDRVIEHPTATEMNPLVVFGKNLTATATGLDFDGACISLGPFEGSTFSSGATIGIDTVHDSLNTSTAEVLLDLSSNGHALVLTKGPHNALTLFGRQEDRITVIDTAHDVLTNFTSITLAVGKSHAMVFVNSTLTLHGPWTGGLVKFDGSLRVGCSSTEDNVWFGKLQKLFIFTGLSTTLQNISSTLPTEPPRVTSVTLDIGSGDDSGSGSGSGSGEV